MSSPNNLFAMKITSSIQLFAVEMTTLRFAVLSLACVNSGGSIRKFGGGRQRFWRQLKQKYKHSGHL